MLTRCTIIVFAKLILYKYIKIGHAMWYSYIRTLLL